MNRHQKFNRPSALKPGDKVAIISPSSGMPFLFPWVYEQGVNRIREIFQLEPVEFPSALRSPEYLSQNPKVRAEDINVAFADPSIKGIIATIGGNDQIRILPYLDKEVIQANPQVFMGYSDCTNLHLFLWNLEIVSYYGGAVMTQFAMGGGMQDYTIQSIRKALFHPPVGKICPSLEYSDADLDWADKSNLNKKRPMYPGTNWYWHNNQDTVIKGRLWGGCLEVLDLHLSIKRYLPIPEQLDQTILFVETSEEMPSEGFVYRFFAALAELNLLNKFQAILMAYPKAQFCEKQPPEGREAFIVNQQNAVKNALKDYKSNLLVVFNMNFGHTDPQIIVPSGGDVQIDCKAKTIEFL
ncbi:MAG: LD-carboxypeptidase [Verrucomicrobia bacterium]|nr:LD-carboxypeptidase [Verrucomicrobiota bacterium]MBS0645881.1 LD-carboxypeptidase [Verrucomicrobiota bacterium]